MLSVLADLRARRTDQFVVFGNGVGPRSPVLAGASWDLKPLSAPTRRRRLARFVDQLVVTRLRPGRRELVHAAYRRLSRTAGVPAVDAPLQRPEIRDWLARCGVDLMVYPAPIPLAFEAETPYVMAVHDLQHRIHPEFPEVSAGHEFAHREYTFRNGIRNALMVVVDSDIGKEDVLTYYGELISPERVAVLPFLPATPSSTTDQDRQRVKHSYDLPDRFLFYPAQFWPHKNHIKIIEALATLRRSDGIDAHLVLVGSASGGLRKENYARFMSTARELDVEHCIHHLGYVPAGDMASLYASAEALVMPTFFGPTNIPILEAWGLDCPVITSDIRGVREQAGDAALLADPTSAEQLADAIRSIWLDKDLRNDLIERGRRRLRLNTRDDYAERLTTILDTAKLLASGQSPTR
jgi:glycosyltransferase involved in cell wall biosynthesis